MAYKQKGVIRNPWQASVRIDKRRYYLGNFATKEAAEAVEAAFRAENGRPPNPKTAQSFGLGSGMGHRTSKHEYRNPKPILNLHPCFECPLAECDDTSKLCALRVVFNRNQNAIRHKRPISAEDRRRYNIARSELAAIHKENLADA